MKTFFLIVFIGLTIQAFSQGRDEQYMPPTQQNQTQSTNGTIVNLNIAKVNHYKKMRTTGIVLTSIGSAFVISGIILFANGLSIPSTGGLGQVFGGFAIGAGGIACLGVGIPNLIIGSRNRYQVSINFAPTGCKIAYTF